jgi:aspartate/methionine/tyrosine aminotransferase
MITPASSADTFASACSSQDSPASLLPRRAVLDLYPSRIREVANAGFDLPDMLRFWFGEPDRPTSKVIRDAARAAIDEGQTFYTHNLGIPALRDAIAQYVGRLHGCAVARNQVAVTSSGVSALALVHQALAGPGARVVCVTPVWPNLAEAPRIQGASVHRVALRFSGAQGGWTLDLDELMAALTPGTATLILNSPGNPTGWAITREQQHAVLAHCRRLGIWIIADDVYERIWFGHSGFGHSGFGHSGFDHTGTGNDLLNPQGQVCAPSFLDIADAHDRLISINSFSKAWRMTGWRLGWMLAPAEFIAAIGTVIEYNTSCAPGFVQAAGIVALEQGEADLASELARYRAARDALCDGLRALSIEVSPAPGAMYAFFCARDAHGAPVADTVAFCKQLVREQHLGLAPGSAFGPEGEGFIRWCFASECPAIEQGLLRLARGLRRE